MGRRKSFSLTGIAIVAAVIVLTMAGCEYLTTKPYDPKEDPSSDYIFMSDEELVSAYREGRWEGEMQHTRDAVERRLKYAQRRILIREQVEQEKMREESTPKSEAQIKLDTYKELLIKSGVDMFDSLSVRKMGDDMWELTLTVKNIWHIRHKQIRLQDAQVLWESWAMIASPSRPDSARLKLVDFNGNEVGGSRLIAGSMIWVQD